MRLKIIELICLGFLFCACQQHTSFEFVSMECEDAEIVANTTIQSVKDIYVFGRPVLIEENLIIEGYVVSNDRAGNFYKSLSIQDKPMNPTVAISISVDASNLYTKYELGRKVFVKLKGLAIGNYFGRLQIGQLNNGEMQGVSSFEYENHLIKSCDISELQALKVSAKSLNESHLDMFLTFSDVQFNDVELGRSFGEPTSNKSIDRVLDFYEDTCEKTGSINVRTSGFADFKNYSLPEGSGFIQGVLQNYYSDLQLVLRTAEDVLLSEERCREKPWEPTLTLGELRNMYQGEIVEFNTSLTAVVAGYVVSSDQEGNFTNRIVIQDAVENPSAGIQVLMEKEQLFESFAMGERVLVKINRLYMDNYQGNLSLGIHKKGKVIPIEEAEIGNFILGTKEYNEVVPKKFMLKDIRSAHKQTLIQVENVQLDSLEIGKSFSFYSGNEGGVRTLVNCETFQKLQMYTSGTAAFANDAFPEGKGSVTGVLGDYMELNNAEDVFFPEPYEACPSISPPILITEVADPVNSVGSRFVEIFNSGDTPIALDGWKLEKFVNGSTTVSSEGVDLSEIVMDSNSYIVIANIDFETVFGVKPTISSSYISGNGDDAYRLVDSSGKTIDIYGAIGTDGNGENWEYLDGGAVRKKQVKIPNKNFDFNEWIVTTKANNFSVNNPNTPKYAPKDYSPFSE